MFFTHDHYTQPTDRFRSKVAGLQDAAASTLRQLYDDLNVTVLDVPSGLETAQRVDWISQRVTHTRLDRAG